MNKTLSINLFKKYQKSILLIVGGFMALGLLIPYFIKPSFKVTSVISISPSYFQNSLMREFLSEVYDPSELRSQRQSILNEALDVNFLDQVSAKTGQLPDNEAEKDKAMRRLLLRKSIEIIPLQLSDFQISVIDSDRQHAMSTNQMTIDNILKILKEKRTRMLLSLRDAIGLQLESVSPNRAGSAMISAEAVQMKIDKLEREILINKEKFSSRHPALKKQMDQMAQLKAQQARAEKLSISNANQDMVASTNVKENTGNTTIDDLARKQRYLNIVLQAENVELPAYFSIVQTPEYPLAAIWPKKSLFLIWFTLLGVLAAMIYVAAREFLVRNSAKQNTFAAKNYSMNNVDFVEPTSDNRATNHDDARF